MGRVTGIVARANRKLTVQLAAILLASSTLLSSALGFLRDRLLNGMYYDTYKSGIDAYTVAFTVPDFMFFILVSGALSVTFIPVFNQRLASGNKKSAWELSTSMINLMALVTLVASILIIIFAELLVKYVVGPGLDEASSALAVSMMRVIAVNPFLFAIATVIASIQQAVGRFTFFALAPTMYNIGIIIGTLVFTRGINIFGWQIFEGGIMGVALGVVLGSILQLVVSSIGLFGLGLDYRFKIYWRNRGLKKVLSLLPARSFDQGIDYVNSIVETNLASRMATGTVRAYQQATTLHMFPINLIGVAISTAAFPGMTESLTKNRPDLFNKGLESIIKVIVWLTLPTAIIVFFTRGYLVNFIKNGGDPLMAGILGALVLAIFFRAIFHIASRSFYAQQDTKTPLFISIFAIGLNIALAIWFSMSLGFGAYGLAWAQSIGAIVEVVILFFIMKRRSRGLFGKEFRQSMFKMVSVTGFMSAITYTLVMLMPLSAVGESSFFNTFPKFFLIVSLSLISYLFISKLMKITEADPVIKKLNQLFFGGKAR